MDNHSYNSYTWGHYEQLSGDFQTGMEFKYVKNLQSDVPTFNYKLIPYKLIKSRGKMKVPALHGNTMFGSSNSETNYCGLNSIPKKTLYRNPLQDASEQILYVSVQPQTYTILI